MSKQTNNHELLIADVDASASSSKSITHRVNLLLEQQTFSPLFIQGDAKDVLTALPTGLVDFCMTSPPYWGKREYENGGIGLENTFEAYVVNGAIVSASGVSGVRYKRQIELSTHLTEDEKQAAMVDLDHQLRSAKFGPQIYRH